MAISRDLLSPGRRVRVARPIELYPIAVFEAGLLGTIRWVAAAFDQCEGDSHIYTVRLDRHFPELEEWDNELYVYPSGELSPAVTESDFELLDVGVH